MILVVNCSTSKEGFGGQVKNIQYIPLPKCINICNDYYNVCMDKYKNIDAGQCYDYFKKSCVNSCIYNRFHSV